MRELVRFDTEREPASLRVWNAVDGDLVERPLNGSVAASQCLPAYWSIAEDATLGHVLRLARDAAGLDWYPSLTDRVRALEAELSRLAVAKSDA